MSALALFVWTLVFLGLTSAVKAQTQSTTDDLLAFVEARLAQMPGAESGLYRAPDSRQLDAFGNAVAALAAGDTKKAEFHARTAGYELGQFFDAATGQGFHALLPVAGGDAGRGFFFVRSEATSLSDVVFSAPQPLSSPGSAQTAARQFLDMEGRGLALAGAHRCASSQPSGCAGLTTACSSVPEGYRASDVAHAPSSYFQVFHERLAASSSTLTTLQIVGMEDASRDGAVFRISDGTTNDHHGSSAVVSLHDRLEKSLQGIDSSFHGTSCNLDADPDLDCAQDNSLGRVLNGVDACGTAPGFATGRFVSLALDAILLGDGPSGPQGPWSWVKAWLAPIGCPAPDAQDVSVEVAELFPQDNASATELKQYVRLSPSLLQSLGLGGEVFDGSHHEKPQIRVTMTTPDNGRSAPFVIVDTFAHQGSAIQIHSEDGEPSGLAKLFGVDDLDAVADLDQARVSIWNLASGETRHETLFPFRDRHICEPENGFGELYDRRTYYEHGELLLLVPHGGDIETGTSELILPVRDTMLGYGVTTNFWEARGFWDGSGSAHTQWHVTSTAIRDDAFPGLAAVHDGNDQTIDYDYTLALHGYGSTAHHGMVIGGKSSMDSKCYLAEAVRQHLSNNQLDPDSIDIRIYGTGNACVELSGFELAESSTSHLAGTASQNVVNRYTDRDPALPGSGGVQVEMSKLLRGDWGLSETAIRGLAHGLAALIEDPSIDVSASCNAFVSCP